MCKISSHLTAESALTQIHRIPQHTFEGWEIACLVNLVTTIEEEDNVIRCRLDFDSEHHSQP